MNTPPENHCDYNVYLIMGSNEAILIDEKRNRSKRVPLPELTVTEENWEAIFNLILRASEGTGTFPAGCTVGCVTFPAGIEVVEPLGNA